MPEEIRVDVEILPHGRGLPLPERGTPGSSGVDLRAAVEESLTIGPGERAVVPTGLRVAVPAGFEWQVRPRSGLAAGNGVTVLNSPGTVDSDYRGEVCVVLVNLGETAFVLKRGDRIAQAVLCPVAAQEIRPCRGLADTERGSGGFGHTGL
jgi:dUTP pyrophosphatase